LEGEEATMKPLLREDRRREKKWEAKVENEKAP
jgi:hypothetical protein